MANGFRAGAEIVPEMTDEFVNEVSEGILSYMENYGEKFVRVT